MSAAELGVQTVARASTPVVWGGATAENPLNGAPLSQLRLAGLRPRRPIRAFAVQRQMSAETGCPTEAEVTARETAEMRFDKDRCGDVRAQ
jgi:hypothetical protein